MKIDKKIVYKLLTSVFFLNNEALVSQELSTEGQPRKPARPSLNIGTASELSRTLSEETFFVLPPATIPLTADSPLPRVNPLELRPRAIRQTTFIPRSGGEYEERYGHDLIRMRRRAFRDSSLIAAACDGRPAKRGRVIKETIAGVVEPTQGVLTKDIIGEVEEALTTTQSVHSDDADMSSQDGSAGRPSKILRNLVRTRSFVHPSFSPAV